MAKAAKAGVSGNAKANTLRKLQSAGAKPGILACMSTGVDLGSRAEYYFTEENENPLQQERSELPHYRVNKINRPFVEDSFGHHIVWGISSHFKAYSHTCFKTRQWKSFS